MAEMRSRLQDVQRRAAQQELEAVALELFLDRGYADTTVDDVAAVAGVSRRTIFRYFETKEDLVLASMRETGTRLAQTIREQPQQLSAWAAITQTLLDFAAELDADAPRARPRGRLLLDTPALHASLSAKHLQWRALMADAVAPRVPASSSRQLRAEALVATALACLDVATTAWTRAHEGPTARERFDIALETVAHQTR